MLNKEGQTPLDVAIIETLAAAEFKAKKTRQKAQQNEGGDDQKLEQEQIDAEIEFEKETEKAMMLIQRMQKYGPECSIKFVQKPHRLDLMFEKSFAMAVKKNNNDILDLFPINSIKTAYVSMH